MKRTLIIILLVLSSFNLFAKDVKGKLAEFDGKRILTLWGTHQERGYAQGYLLGEDFNRVFNNYVLNYECGGSLMVYSALRNLFIASYSVEEKYKIEAEAMLQAMLDKDIELYNDVLGREIDATDILICTATPDLS